MGDARNLQASPPAGASARRRGLVALAIALAVPGGAFTTAGASADDTLTGNAGNDWLIGDAGSDVLDALDGEIDELDCGANLDTTSADPADVLDSSCP